MALLRGVPLKSIVAIILSIVFLLVLGIAYMIMKEYHVFFTTGVILMTIICFISVSNLQTYRKDLEKVNEIKTSNIVFTTCPEYWTTTMDGKNLICTNRFGNLKIDKKYAEGETPADMAEIIDENAEGLTRRSPDEIQVNNLLKNGVLHVETMNKLSIDEKCRSIKQNGVVWVEATNKCPNF